MLTGIACVALLGLGGAGCKNKGKNGGTDAPGGEGGTGEVASGPTGPKPPSLPDPAPKDDTKAPVVENPDGPVPEHNDRDPEEEKRKMSLSRDRSAKAVEHLEAGRLDQAIAEARQALRIHEQNAQAMLVVAEAFYKQGKHEIVQSVTSSILNIDPKRLSATEESRAHNLKGFAYLQQGKRPSAMKEFRLAADKDAKNATAWNNLGVLYMWQGDHKTAVSVFDYALELDKKFIGAHLNRGAALRGMGQLADAKSAFEQVIALDANHAMAYFNLGVLYLDGEALKGVDVKSRLGEAIAKLTKYKQLAANQPQPKIDAKLNTGLGQNPLGNELVTEEQAQLYIEAAEKGIEREKRREEREARRKERDAKKKAKEAAEKAEGGGGDADAKEGEKSGEGEKPQSPKGGEGGKAS